MKGKMKGKKLPNIFNCIIKACGCSAKASGVN